jgi:hypothetical protein
VNKQAIDAFLIAAVIPADVCDTKPGSCLLDSKRKRFNWRMSSRRARHSALPTEQDLPKQDLPEQDSLEQDSPGRIRAHEASQ